MTVLEGAGVENLVLMAGYPATPWLNNDLALIYDAMESYAKQNDVGFIDLRGVVPESMTTDGVHPTVIGHQALANAVPQSAIVTG